jgi:enoyl-CoA hydratase/carnithine racemase
MMNYEVQDKVALITIDDGKANVVGHQFLDEINAALDRAESEDVAAVILKGRDGMFSGGFDLSEFQKGVSEGLSMVHRGFELLVRLYSFPLPTVAAATGHSVAMGAFLVMACDSRIAARGKYKITLPETAIGMDLPPFLVELTASRVRPDYMTRVALQAEVFNPDSAVEAGFVDEAVEPADLDSRALEVATKLSQLPQPAYAKNKLWIRANALDAMKADLARQISASS